MVLRFTLQVSLLCGRQVSLLLLICWLRVLSARTVKENGEGNYLTSASVEPRKTKYIKVKNYLLQLTMYPWRRKTKMYHWSQYLFDQLRILFCYRDIFFDSRGIVVSMFSNSKRVAFSSKASCYRFRRNRGSGCTVRGLGPSLCVRACLVVQRVVGSRLSHEPALCWCISSWSYASRGRSLLVVAFECSLLGPFVCLLVFSVAERGERKISSLDRRLICSFSSVQFCFVGFEATSLGVYRFRIVFSS